LKVLACCQGRFHRFETQDSRQKIVRLFQWQTRGGSLSSTSGSLGQGFPRCCCCGCRRRWQRSRFRLWLLLLRQQQHLGQVGIVRLLGGRHGGAQLAFTVRDTGWHQETVIVTTAGGVGTRGGLSVGWSVASWPRGGSKGEACTQRREGCFHSVCVCACGTEREREQDGGDRCDSLSSNRHEAARVGTKHTYLGRRSGSVTSRRRSTTATTGSRRQRQRRGIDRDTMRPLTADGIGHFDAPRHDWT
jgi:hypothetical protein